MRVLEYRIASCVIYVEVHFCEVRNTFQYKASFGIPFAFLKYPNHVFYPLLNYSVTLFIGSNNRLILNFTSRLAYRC